jgi:hypothetical protein
LHGLTQEVAQLLEQELVLSNLLGAFLPLLKFVVANDSGHFSNPSLRSAAVMALCRYMTVSSLCTEQLLALAFTVLEQDSSAPLRTSIMVALGDLAFRFPNSLEPWTDRFYARLRDEDDIIRYNALVILTHLVLNDMIKVKNQVFQVALALLDPVQSIRDLARLFFLKLSERSHNPVYNLLGDIISRLSQDERMEAEAFQELMRFLLSFVKKDKQADQLLERLLARLAAAESTRTRKRIAFCISELSVSDKGLKKLLEAVKSIKIALQDDEVFRCFELLLSKAKKGPGASSSGGGAADADTGAGADEPAAATGPAASKAVVASGTGTNKALLQEVEKALQQMLSGAEEGIEEGVECTVQRDGELSLPTTGEVAAKPKKMVSVVKKKKAESRKNPRSKATSKRATSARSKKQVSSDEENDDAETDSDGLADEELSSAVPKQKGSRSRA